MNYDDCFDKGVSYPNRNSFFFLCIIVVFCLFLVFSSKEVDSKNTSTMILSSVTKYENIIQNLNRQVVVQNDVVDIEKNPSLLDDLSFNLGYTYGLNVDLFSCSKQFEKNIESVRVVEPERKFRKQLVKVTAYCPCAKCCGRMTGLTKTEMNAWRPGVAVDPRKIPLYTHIDIPGYPRNDGKWIMADDTGKKVKGWHIDVRFQYHWQCLEWMRQLGTEWLEITIYDE